MSMDNKPCKLVVVAISRGTEFAPQDVTDREGRTIRYRSVRHARECILDAAWRMDPYSSCHYRIDIVTEAGEVLPVRDSAVDYAWRFNRNYTYDNCIAARLRRGETVVW